MNTPAHLIVGMAAFARPNAVRLNAAAFVGSLAPDVSLYVLGCYALFIQNIPPAIVFGQMYYSDEWQQVFAIDNSVFLWLALAFSGYWMRRDWLFVFGLAGLLHLATDFPLHHDDGRQHFWPLTDWVFSSPISYWDPTRYGWFIGPAEGLLCLGLALWMCFNFKSLLARAMIAALTAAEIVPVLGPLIIGFD